jgi:hypothetical protein
MVRIDIKLLITSIGMAAFFSSTPISITSHGNQVRLGAQREVCMMMALRLRARAISVPHV